MERGGGGGEEGEEEREEGGGGGEGGRRGRRRRTGADVVPHLYHLAPHLLPFPLVFPAPSTGLLSTTPLFMQALPSLPLPWYSLCLECSSPKYCMANLLTTFKPSQ